MRTGQIDIMHQIHPKDVATAKTERGMKVSEIASLWWQGIHLNNQVAPFTNKAIRQAVWYAVDRSVIQRVAYHTAWRMALLVNRSEEHTSELQSRPHLVCRLLLEKKKLP